MLGGNHSLYVASVFGQILFSGGLFLFWLVYADGMSSVSADARGVCFYLPKLLLVGVYVGVSATMFVPHGRLPPTASPSPPRPLPNDSLRTPLRQVRAARPAARPHLRHRRGARHAGRHADGARRLALRLRHRRRRVALAARLSGEDAYC